MRIPTEEALYIAEQVDWPGGLKCAESEAARVIRSLTAERDEAVAENEKLREELRWLVDQHHRTLTGSAKHDPENLDWTECPCGSCSRVAFLLAGSGENQP